MLKLPNFQAFSQVSDPLGLKGSLSDLNPEMLPLHT